MPLQATSGAASYDAFGGGVPVVPAYIEEVFSTYLYAGNDDTQVITNGIDLSTKGGLVWCKSRTLTTSANHVLFDSARGVNKLLFTNTTGAQQTSSGGVGPLSFNTTGFTLQQNWAGENRSSSNQVSWTFRKQPKFFDIQTWTGTGANRTISHALGSVPACIMVKRTDTTGNWQVYHRSMANTEYLVLNSDAAKATGATRWNSTTPTSTVFSIGTDTTVNASGGTYVAYIFAHDAGGFGLTGTDNVISCGSYTGNDAAIGTFVNVGFEPQWLLIKASVSPDNTQNWRLVDNMRGIPMSDQDMILAPNTSAAETDSNTCNLDARGFYPTGPNYNANGFTYIYIAIRRGPMKVPTTGTSVFSPIAVNAMQGTQQTTNFPVDMQLIANRGGETRNFSAVDRLRGVSTNTTSTYRGNITSSTDAESTSVVFATQNWNSTGFQISANTAETTALFHSFKRAPSFMDVVCYTGTGANATWSHNLGAVPEMMIVKKRSGVANWAVYHSALGAAGYAILNTTAASTSSSTFWQSTTPTATSFYTGTNGNVGDSGLTYVAYLFATLANVSKVGSYTGNGSSQTIACGFTGGARFVLIKRTDSTGDWYVWDTARGIVSGNDPYLLLNSTAAEVTSTDYIDTYSAGFEISSTAPAAINASGGSFIFLAIS